MAAVSPRTGVSTPRGCKMDAQQFRRLVAFAPQVACGLLLLVGCRGSKRELVEEQQPFSKPPAAQVPLHTASAASEEKTKSPGVRPVGAASVAPNPAKPESAAELVDVPAGSVTIDGKATAVAAFAIDRTEVTVQAYESCVAAKECSPAKTEEAKCNWQERKAKGNHPINCVSMKQAGRYCEQRGQRLPTAAQWQLAAGGPEKRRYPWGEDHASNVIITEPVNGKYPPGPARRKLCWEGDNTDDDPAYPLGTCPVGSYPTGNTPSGIADLAGNVGEWTSTAVEEPGAPRYVIKGGGFPYDPLGPLEVGVEDWRALDDQHWASDIGFRCVTTVVRPH
jgi:formylglycine-generating enzyme required for sulfatase activity